MEIDIVDSAWWIATIAPFAPTTARQTTWASDSESGDGSWSRRVTVPFAARRRTCAARKEVTASDPFWSRTSRRSRSTSSVSVGAPPAAGSVTSSPVAQATMRLSEVGSHVSPRGAGHTARRPTIVPLATSMLTTTPDPRSAT